MAFIDVVTVDVSAVVLGLAWKPRVVVIVLIVQQQQGVWVVCWLR